MWCRGTCRDSARPAAPNFSEQAVGGWAYFGAIQHPARGHPSLGAASSWLTISDVVEPDIRGRCSFCNVVLTQTCAVYVSNYVTGLFSGDILFCS